MLHDAEEGRARTEEEGGRGRKSKGQNALDVLFHSKIN